MSEQEPTMSIRDAHATLRLHQAWRLGGVTNDMMSASEVTKAIAVLLLFVGDELVKQEAEAQHEG